jgi:glycine/D-amino acid oxidase-like deaminating enzyme
VTDSYDSIVIGAGALGAATAYHLLREGQHVALLDRGRAVDETSPRAAGMGMQIQADDELSSIARLGIEKLMAFEADTGEALEVFQAGSIKVARTDADAAQLCQEVQRGKAMGVAIDQVSREEAQQIVPWYVPDSARAIWYAPHDIYLEPGDLPRAYVRALLAGGGTLLEHAEVARLGVVGDRATHAELSDGRRIEAGAIVLATGAWIPRLTATVGITVPLWPIRHELVISAPVEGVTNQHPAVRIMDTKCYVRPCRGGMMFGAYEPNPLQLDTRELPGGYRIEQLPLDMAPLQARIDEVAAEFPALLSTPFTELRGGLPTTTPDSHFLAGPLPLDGLWILGGDNVGGLSTSPALGSHLAHWIATGDRHEDIVSFDPARFGDRFADPGTLRAACFATYVDKYSNDEVAVR